MVADLAPSNSLGKIVEYLIGLGQISDSPEDIVPGVDLLDIDAAPLLKDLIKEVLGFLLHAVIHQVVQLLNGRPGDLALVDVGRRLCCVLDFGGALDDQLVGQVPVRYHDADPLRGWLPGGGVSAEAHQAWDRMGVPRRHQRQRVHLYALGHQPPLHRVQSHHSN